MGITLKKNNLLHTNPKFDFSFIVPMRNNTNDLRVSLDSICAEAPSNSEVIVVDGSDNLLGEELVRAMLSRSDISLTYKCDDKTGVFGAMNVGVLATKGLWIIMMPAGDYINFGAGKILENIKDSDLDAIVFAQDMATPTGVRLYSFFPTSRTIWPHHSVALKRAVHERFGLYPLEYHFSSDQQFFANVRRHIRFEVRPDVLTTFLLGGISSSASIRLSRELYELRRKLGHGVLSAYFRAYVTPNVRAWIERNVGYGNIAMKVRVLFFSNYRRD